MRSIFFPNYRIFITVVYLIAITIAEIIVVFSQPLAGIIAHLLVLTALLVHASLKLNDPGHRLLLALTLAPLTRILSLATPVTMFPQIFWFPLIYGPLLLAAFLVIFNLRIPLGEIGFKWGKIPVQILVILVAPILGTIEYLILAPAGLVAPPLTFKSAWLPAFIIIATTGFVEELIFRGILQKLSKEVVGSWGWIYVSFLFAVLHLGFLTIADVLYVFAVAVLFSWVVKKSGSLLGVSLSHGLSNVFLYVVIPALVTT
ncbi:MAG: CPBP family intramembrane metalloprotease [Dehalococcoidia bacterium]|nr:CPBP family intramembrane metalloprotease [Dehalococcoidia bacterium]